MIDTCCTLQLLWDPLVDSIMRGTKEANMIPWENVFSKRKKNTKILRCFLCLLWNTFVKFDWDLIIWVRGPPLGGLVEGEKGYLWEIEHDEFPKGCSSPFKNKKWINHGMKKNLKFNLYLTKRGSSGSSNSHFGIFQEAFVSFLKIQRKLLFSTNK